MEITFTKKLKSLFFQVVGFFVRIPGFVWMMLIFAVVAVLVSLVFIRTGPRPKLVDTEESQVYNLYTNPHAVASGNFDSS